MGTLSIQLAERAGARIVVCLAGISGSGKTFTGLQLAYGLANRNAKKVGLLCTENRRGRLYSDILKDGAGNTQQFYVGDLEAPFSPKRYVESILEFQRAGVEVLVIDSVSHEWEGIGGCEEIAHAGNPRLPDWATAKREHKAFMNTLLQSDMHIIVCARAREKVKVSKVGGKTEVESIGIQPIVEKNFMFEMTASLLMWDEGRKQEVYKCPAELRPILGREKDYLTVEDGEALRKWVDGGVAQDPEVERARNSLRTVTENGVDKYREAWNKTPKRVRDILTSDGTHESLKAAALAYDEQRRNARPGGESLAGLNDELSGEPAES
jgi:hypothetical protein